MVVCKCRKATRLYCFVHKVPVCGECICFPEHQICVVKKYSDWVVDGEYDWPTACAVCHVAFEAGSESQTTRLGCLHLTHTDCLVSHIRGFPPQTAPAGYVCPECSSTLWPPKSIKDTGSRLHSKLKEAIVLSGLEKNVFGNHLVSLPMAEPQAPPAFASEPLVHLSTTGDGENNLTISIEDPTLSASSFGNNENYTSHLYSSTLGISASQIADSEIVEIDDPSTTKNQFTSDQDPSFMKSTSPQGGPTTRKGAFAVDRQNSEISYYADDEEGNLKKYSRRERRVRHQRPSRMDPRKLLLIIAIMACMATMGILYYRLAQRSLGENMPEDEPQ